MVDEGQGVVIMTCFAVPVEMPGAAHKRQIAAIPWGASVADLAL